MGDQLLVSVVHRLSELVNVSASIGIAMYPNHGADMETLLKHADDAMYQAKYSGRDYDVIAGGK